MFTTWATFIFWLALPYIIAAASMIAHKRLGASERPKQEAVQLGHEFAKIARGIMNPVTPKKG